MIRRSKLCPPPRLGPSPTHTRAQTRGGDGDGGWQPWGRGPNAPPPRRANARLPRVGQRKKKVVATVCCVGRGACSPNHAIPNKPRPVPWGLLPHPPHVAQQRMVAGPQGMGCLRAVGGGWGAAGRWPGQLASPESICFRLPWLWFCEFLSTSHFDLSAPFFFRSRQQKPHSLFRELFGRGMPPATLDSLWWLQANHRMSASTGS